MAAGSTSPPVPRVERASPGLAFVESDERPGMHYRTSPHSCSCPDWTHRRASRPAYRCKHMELAFPIRCAQCGTNQVPGAGDFCSWCAEDLNEQAIAGGSEARR